MSFVPCLAKRYLRSKKQSRAQIQTIVISNSDTQRRIRTAPPLDAYSQPSRGLGDSRNPPLRARAKAASRGSMAAIVLRRLRRPGRPASANRTAAEPPMLDPTVAAARGWAAISDAIRCNAWENSSRRRQIGAILSAAIPRLRKTLRAHARERLGEQPRKSDAG
jgi:hypothetical protein